MNRITFRNRDLMKMLDQSEFFWGNGTRRCFSDQEPEGQDIPRKFWLVGDEGVYLMSNAIPPKNWHEGSAFNVAYSEECNPKTMEFDDWWQTKRELFGGDDGIESFDAEEYIQAIRAGDDIVISLSPESMIVSVGKEMDV